jgi:hypothetical protein
MSDIIYGIKFKRTENEQKNAHKVSIN